MSTANKLNHLIETKNQIKSALIEKGVEVTDNDTFRSYATRISEINGSSDTNEEWKPESDWWDIDTILENDTENYAQKAIFLLTDQLDGGNVIDIKGFTHYKTSDGQEFTKGINETLNISNIFNTVQDKECAKGYKTRYIIGYTDLDNNTINSNIEIPNNSIYIIYNNIYTSTKFSSLRYLQGAKFKNNCKFSNFSSMFNNCYSLKIVLGLDTLNGTNFSNMFNNCSNLQTVPEIDISNGTNFSSMFSNCSNLKIVPEIDTSNGITFSNMFSYCYSLQTIPELDTSNGTNFSSMFNNCYSLQTVPEIDISNGTIISNIFNNCYSLSKFNIISISQTMYFSTTSLLTHSSLLNILNALVDLTGGETKILTLGSINLAKLTNEEKAIATEKGWTLA